MLLIPSVIKFPTCNPTNRSVNIVRLKINIDVSQETDVIT